MKKRDIFTIPNLVTLIHLLLLPVLCFLLLNQCWFKAGFLFLFTGFLDLLDGFLAHLLKQFSELGKFLDPIVDKLGVIIVLLFLYFETGNFYYKIIFGIYLLMEFFLLGGSFYLVLKKLTGKFQVTKLGKISMFCFFLMLTGFIFNLKIQNQITYLILFCLAVIIFFIRIFSLIKYCQNFFKK